MNGLERVGRVYIVLNTYIEGPKVVDARDSKDGEEA
jgi:hypothetical protein